MEVVDSLTEQYETLLDGDPVPYDIASIYFKENDGFLVRTSEADKAIGMHLIEGGIFISFFDIEDDESDIMVEEENGIALEVSGKTKHRLVELVKNASMHAAPTETNQPDADLGYFG